MDDEEAEMIPERDSFLELGQILERTRRSLARTREELDALSFADERTRLFVASLIGRRRELEGAIERAVEQAGDDVLGTFVQYGADPGANSLDPPEQTSPAELVRYLIRLDGSVADGLRELADRVRHPPARALLEGLLALLDAHDHRVAVQVQAQQDV